MASIKESESYIKALKALIDASKEYEKDGGVDDKAKIDIEEFCKFYSKRKVSVVLTALILVLGWSPGVPAGAVDALKKIKEFFDTICATKAA
ncbi:hypothetical protein [Citrobacter freundii]|uniref:Uncharacterized protein n=1 Tax=Citrobacter freundii TaxID=546 RepID=A0AAN4D3W3_CITFR|nr:hypothetical protein [Citrobacter freundii]ASG44327.1 hypothetical protein CES93_12115 [Citrobacter freundii]EIJ8976424.1 hypothetical protein [Citrobacter freundii]EIJ8981508.1 hypothetical protein [Citrobacter freundii]EJD5388433.1 hypothetical protein [Citrobacter freundii]EJG9718458.1 hypothetical protein [Citrobacter freundii]